MVFILDFPCILLYIMYTLQDAGGTGTRRLRDFNILSIGNHGYLSNRKDSVIIGNL